MTRSMRQPCPKEEFSGSMRKMVRGIAARRRALRMRPVDDSANERRTATYERRSMMPAIAMIRAKPITGARDFQTNGPAAGDKSVDAPLVVVVSVVGPACEGDCSDKCVSEFDFEFDSAATDTTSFGSAAATARSYSARSI